MEQTSDLKQWFAGRQEALAIDVEEIGLANSSEWKVIEQDGKPAYVGHTSGEFHRGVFLKAWDKVRAAWIERFLLQPIPKENGQQLYGIALLARYNGKYLVQAKAEPGNATPGHVQLTTTIQASYTNIKAGLSGKVAFTELYNDPRVVRYVVSQDGAQLYLKKNAVCFLELSEDVGVLGENYTWATLNEIISLAKEDLVSEHMFQCLGVEAMR